MHTLRSHNDRIHETYGNVVYDETFVFRKDAHRNHNQSNRLLTNQTAGISALSWHLN